MLVTEEKECWKEGKENTPDLKSFFFYSVAREIIEHFILLYSSMSRWSSFPLMAGPHFRAV